MLSLSLQDLQLLQARVTLFRQEPTEFADWVSQPATIERPKDPASGCLGQHDLMLPQLFYQPGGAHWPVRTRQGIECNAFNVRLIDHV